MAIQIPNPGTGNGASGDNEFVLWSKVKDNFSDQTNAASRIVGTAEGNVMEVGAFGLGGTVPKSIVPAGEFAGFNGFFGWYDATTAQNNAGGTGFMYGINCAWSNENNFQIGRTTGVGNALAWRSSDGTAQQNTWHSFYTSQNTTKDSNGFLKGASPVVDLYDEKIDLNYDAKEQGGITFERLGVGDYLVKGSLGFAQEGWHIETPKDTNGNVLVAVVETQLENNDLSIKTYAKRFDDETGDIVANLTKPRDIPAGRFISLRLHELPKEPPVMPSNIQNEEIVELGK